MAFKHSSYLYPFAILNRRKYNSVTTLKIYIYTSFFIFWQFCKFYWYLFNNNKRYYCYYYYYYHYYYLKKLRNSDVLFLILQGWFFSSLLHRIFEYLNIFSEKTSADFSRMFIVLLCTIYTRLSAQDETVKTTWNSPNMMIPSLN